MPDASAIARLLSEAYAADWRKGRHAIGDVLADTVEIRHEPRMETDCPRPRAELQAAMATEFEVFAKLMPDFREETSVAVDGDTVVLETVLVATTPEGEPMRAPLRQTLTVTDGEVTAMTGAADPEVFSKLIAVLSAGGMPVGGN